MSEEIIKFVSANEKSAFAKSTNSADTNVVDVDTAETNTRNHRNNNPFPGKLVNADGKDINGFYFRYENGLLEMLNKSGLKGFYLGLGLHPSGKGYTLYLYGVNDENGNALSLNLTPDEVFEFCDVCPTKCPA